MTNVTIQGKELGAALVYQAEKCRFSNITVSGKATIGGAGIVDSARSCDFTDCTSKVNADIKVTDALPGYFAGISWGDENSNFRNCRNKGNITLTGAWNEDTSFSVYGIAMITKKIEKCVNTGNLTIKNTAKGDAGLGLEFEACGVAGEFRDGSCNYNVGKVTAKGKYAMAGEIAGYVSGENTVSDNYYTGSGKKSGREYTSWVPYQSKAKKVSSITSANCPKLSSKYWTYSSKHKRLILKNNKEA